MSKYLELFNIFIFGAIVGWIAYPLVAIVKKILNNARAASSNKEESDPYQNPQNWGR